MAHIQKALYAGNTSSRIPSGELEALQASLRAYAGALLGAAAEVEDIVQEANLYLLRNEMKFEPGTNLRAWAFSVVHYRVLAWRRDRQRNKEDLFSDETLEVIAKAAEEAPDMGTRAEILGRCLGRLAPADRQLLEWKYVERRKLADLAKRGGSNENTLHQKVSRLRQALRLCIRKSLGREENH